VQPEESHCVKSKVAAKKWLDCRLIEKILITTIQVNWVPNPNEMQRKQHKFTRIEILTISLPSQPFLSHHFGFHIFFLQWQAAHFFYSWAVLG